MERIDDLQINGLRLIQDTEKYCFTSDAVLLANHVAVTAKSRILDLCTGSGIIAILLAGKHGAREVAAVELQEDLANIAKRNVKLNNLDDKVSVLNISVQDAVNAFATESFDIVVTNPPYQKPKADDEYQNEGIAICKYELKLTLDELLNTTSRLLKFGGKFYMVHRADRLAEIIYKLKKVKLEPKVLTLVYPKAEKAPDTVIFECIKGAAEGVKIKSLVVFEEDNTYTADAKRLYSKD